MSAINSGGGGIRQYALDAKVVPFRKWANAMEGMQGAAGVNVSLGVGAAPQGEVSVGAAEYNGVTMDEGDEIYFLLSPYEMWMVDFAYDIHARVTWQMPTGTDTGITWTLDMKGVAAGEAPSDAKVSPDATKTFPAKAGNGVADGFVETVWASMNSQALFLSDNTIQCAITLTSDGDASAGEIRLIAVDFRGTQSLMDPNGPQRT